MKGIQLYTILYYEKSVFKGSYRGMNFRLGKSQEGKVKRLTATAWRGPLILEKTQEEPVKKEFDFSDDGIAQAEQWLEEQQKIICGGGQ